MRYARRGWFGHSQEHAMAARGIRLYAKKNVLMQPLFYAQRNEQNAPMWEITDAVRGGMKFEDLVKKYPMMSEEDLRKRGIVAIDNMNGNRMMADLNSPSYGVEKIEEESRRNPEFGRKVLSVLQDEQMRSYCQKPKVEALMERLG